MSSDLALRSVDDLKVLAQTLGVSALLPNALRGKPADVLVTILYGQELGLSPMQAIQGIYVVNGRPTLSAQTWLALARRAGHRIAVTEHTDDRCTVRIVRGDTDEEHVSTYTYAEAQVAKLTSKDVWIQHRKAMLLARAVSQGCRFICPEIALGFYAEGELSEDEPEQPRLKPQEPIEDAEIVSPEEIRAELEALAAEVDFAVTQPTLEETA